MLNMELTIYGLEVTLKGIISDLECALDGNRKNKDYQIGKALGAARAIQNMIKVTEEKSDTDEEESGFLI